MPSYTLGIPTSSQSLGVTQQPIQDNFTVIDTTIKVNHVGMSDVSGNQGKHTLIQFPTIQANSPGTAAGEVAIYTRNISSVPQVFFQPQNKAASGTDIQLTANFTPGNLTTSYSPAVTPAGTLTIATFLPGGQVLISGTIINVSATQTVTFTGFNISAISSVIVSRLATETHPPTNRSFHQVTGLSAIPGGFTFESLDDGGSARGGYNVMWFLQGIL